MELMLKHRIVLLLISGFAVIFFSIQFVSLSIFEQEATLNEVTEAQSRVVAAAIQDEDDDNDLTADNFEQLSDNTWHAFDHDRVDGSVTNATEYAIKNELPILLWWTPFTADNKRVKKCNVGKCFFTKDRQFQHHPLTKGFFFYGTDFKPADVPLPRKGFHEWALLHEESPKNNAILSQHDALTLFNHTSTFRQESDYPITTQYLKTAKKLVQKSKYSFENKTNTGLAPVIYLQSGCNPPSDRDAYIQELMKHIDVDAYGKCLHNKDLPDALKDPLTMFSKELFDFVSQYKFAIAFENALCKDYVTEKLWRTLQVGVVPIYRGAPNIMEWLPDESSVIMADDFASPAELAGFIKSVEKNPDKYHSYLKYKTEGITNEKLIQRMENRPWGVNDFKKISPITGFECMVCDRIHRNRKLVEAGQKPLEHVATMDHYGCPKPSMYADYIDPPGSQTWERECWGWDYDNSVVEAGKLRKRVLES